MCYNIRIFMFSNAQCWGEFGGSSGVNYKLYLANEKYKKINNLYHVFANCIIEPGKTIEKVSDSEKLEKEMKGNRLVRLCKNVIKRWAIADIALYYRKLRRAKKWIWQIHEKYKFTAEDRFLFHDVMSAYAFLKLFDMKFTGLVYHQQGSLYVEWNAYSKIKSNGYHKFLNSVMETVFSKVHILAFPSLGAKESLCSGEPSLKMLVDSKIINVVYNGFDKPTSLEPSKAIAELVEKVAFGKKVFITVASLNYAKGVERIPEFLGKLKKDNWNFIWIVIGFGEMEKRLQEEIYKYNIAENVIWLKHFLKHDDILKLFSVSDFYILFHRWSIFDFATIEAMAYETVPILTPVGGNLETVQDGINGFFAEKPYDQLADRLSMVIKDNGLNEMKQKNQEIQNQRFNSEAFLDGYLNLFDSLGRDYETTKTEV